MAERNASEARRGCARRCGEEPRKATRGPASRRGTCPGGPERAAHQLPKYETIALMLQGGGALGAYQAGVFQGLNEAGIEPTGWRAFRSAR